jgi:coproporphyrinogen III oxidase
MISKEEISKAYQDLQDKICAGLESLDGKAKFQEDRWTRAAGGGGKTRVIQDGNVFEKGGVNFSAVSGQAPEFLKKELSNTEATFFATGVSIVIHPRSPFVPIIHMNVRYFEMDETKWFGGGIDLTPIYFFEDDVRLFHRHLKSVCDKFKKTYYPEFKSWADDYFFIRHRNETRGAGGIFFDHLKPSDEMSVDKLFEFTIAIGEVFVPVYSEIVTRNKNKSYDDSHKLWQLIRRGRYAEFNLVYDRGTKFGLETDGRTESILMSLPPLATWKYDHKPLPGSEEEKTQQLLGKRHDWVS